MTRNARGKRRAEFARAGCAALCLAATGAVNATDGYFSHGYGMRSKGMGGVGVALPFDAMAGANNPAGMAWVGNRMDVGIDWFQPRRSAMRSGAAPGLNGSARSDSNDFAVPEFGYNRMLRDDLSLGITVYGAGGMNTDYPGGQLNCGAGPNTANLLCGSGRLGVNLMQLTVAPTVAWKPAAEHSIGVSPLFTFQRFRLVGAQAFDNAPGFPPFTSSPGNVTNNGYDSSRGFGARVGYLGRFDRLAFGASYSSRIHMSEFSKYRGLFAGQGDFDIPARYAVGIAVEATPSVTLAADIERIRYSSIAAIGNSSASPAPLGAANGPGFGWKDVDAVHLGVQWQYSRAITLRAGYNHTSNPIVANEVTFNILAPAVVQDHVTLGMSYALSAETEITAAYMHAFGNSVSGPSLFNAVLGPGAGGTESISMHQNSLGIAISKRF